MATCLGGSPSPDRPPRGPSSRPARRTIDDLLVEARAGFVRLSAREALAEAVVGRAVLIDTRSEDQRQAQGYVREALHHPLSVLEWRLDPDAGWAWDESVTLDSRIVLLCREGFSSSLAAARLRVLGFARATDVIDGVDGWKAAGLPVWSTPT